MSIYMWTLDDGADRYVTVILRGTTMIRVAGEGRGRDTHMSSLPTDVEARESALGSTHNAQRDGLELIHVYGLAGDYLSDEFTAAHRAHIHRASDLLRDAVDMIVNGILRDGERLH